MTSPAPIEAAEAGVSVRDAMDIITSLRTSADQLMRQSNLVQLAGEGVAVRVAFPHVLHAIMTDAADMLEEFSGRLALNPRGDGGAT